MEPNWQTKIFATLVLWKLLLAQIKNSMTCYKFPNPGWHAQTDPVFTSAGLSCSPLMSFVLKGVGSPPHRRRSEAQRVRKMRQWRRCQDWESQPLAFSPRLPFYSRAVYSCSLQNRGLWAPPKNQRSAPCWQGVYETQLQDSMMGNIFECQDSQTQHRKGY